ncbi:uncharacterized protein LOC112088360 [Eutrema salsugineum]|uniref:uncharacterized protein LOC112088360 n=1 Tax=Eutrema salsugineum TaxID=72664 RepID=UPI000CED1A87|nr:uncharacterized protein LOC112088360 [Eutrema salsugineum]
MADYDFVRQLDSQRSDWRIIVKILKKWVVDYSDDNRSLNFILVDERGCRIQARVNNQMMEHFNQICEEDQWEYMLECDAHGELATEIRDKCREYEGPFAICVLTDWCVAIDGENVSIKDHDDDGVSRFITDSPIDEVLTLRNRIRERLYGLDTDDV